MFSKWNKKWNEVVTKKREWKTKIDRGRENTAQFHLYQQSHKLIQSAWEEVSRRLVMKSYTHRKEAGTDRKSEATQQGSSHSSSTCCKQPIHIQTNQLWHVSVCLPFCLCGCLCMCPYVYRGREGTALINGHSRVLTLENCSMLCKTARNICQEHSVVIQEKTIISMSRNISIPCCHIMCP